MTSKHLATAVLISSVAASLLALPVNAQTYGGYGNGGQPLPKNLTVNKLVQDPRVQKFVENLGPSEHMFTAGNEVLYRLVIKNDSGETFHPVTVEDTLPQYLTFVAGPGTYDKGANRLFITLDNVIAGETRTVDILTKVATISALPKDKTSFCVTNKVLVHAPARPDGDDDTAEICIKTGEITPQLPVAGFNDLALLLPFAGIGLTGFALLKKRI